MCRVSAMTPWKDLDENGIIRIGAEVRAGDILVGRLRPRARRS